MSIITPTTGVAVSALVTHDLKLDGSLDADATLALRGPVSELVQDGPVLILVDVTGVTKVTASGVAGILELRRLARSRGADVRLHGVSHAVAQAQVASQLTAITRVYSSREAALLGGRSLQQTAPRGRLGTGYEGVRELAQHIAHAVRERLRPLPPNAHALVPVDTRHVLPSTAAGLETKSKGMNR